MEDATGGLTLQELDWPGTLVCSWEALLLETHKESSVDGVGESMLWDKLEDAYQSACCQGNSAACATPYNQLVLVDWETLNIIEHLSLSKGRTCMASPAVPRGCSSSSNW